VTSFFGLKRIGARAKEFCVMIRATILAACLASAAAFAPSAGFAPRSAVRATRAGGFCSQPIRRRVLKTM
jgi:hypothetical protein